MCMRLKELRHVAIELWLTHKLSIVSYNYYNLYYVLLLLLLLLMVEVTVIDWVYSFQVPWV